MKKMYPAVVNSPKTEISETITENQTEIKIADPSVLINGPGIAVIGNGDVAETILYESIDHNTLLGCTRGYQGTARPWIAGTRVSRNFTAADWDTAKQNIEGLYDRLDAVETKSLTLQPGMQVIQGHKSTFKLGNIKGRTLVNLLGRDGGFESLARIGPYQSTISLDTSNKVSGSSGLKVTISPTFTTGTGTGLFFTVTAGKRYLYVGKAKNGNGSFVQISLPGIGGIASSAVTDKSKFNLVFKKFSPVNTVETRIGCDVMGVAGQYGYFDDLRLYELSAAEYAAIDAMTPEQIDAKYPYVNSIKPVENPYAIRYGENILPPIYEWETIASLLQINGPYDFTTNQASASGFFPAIPNTVYTYSADITGAGQLGISFHDFDGNELQTSGLLSTSKITVTSPSKTAKVQVHVSTPVEGIYKFQNMMLSIGAEIKPFRTREDSMLAFQTELYADPLTGDNADVLFEKDGQYFKVSNWKKEIVSDKYTFAVFGNGKPSFKEVYVSDWNKPILVESPAFMIKFDGKLLRRLEGDKNESDMFGVHFTAGYLYITISNADSGWGPDYSPTNEEIKSYVNGWRMAENSNWGIPYNGTGTKAWGRIDSSGGLVSGSGTYTLPTTLNDQGGYTPYEVVYQRANPVVEPVTYEGQLTLHDGDNIVEVGSGIVLRENFNPTYDLGSQTYSANATGYGKYLKYRVGTVLTIFEDSKRQYGWHVLAKGSALSGNGEWISRSSDKCLTELFLNNSITYLKEDKSPIPNITGSYATNEKALLSNLIDGVQQNAAAISVLRNEMTKDSTKNPWIKPTLLNGWVQYDSSHHELSYRKISETLLQVTGTIKNGAAVGNTVICKFPKDYTPKYRHPIMTYPTGTVLAFDPTSGFIIIDAPAGNTIISIDVIVPLD